MSFIQHHPDYPGLSERQVESIREELRSMINKQLAEEWVASINDMYHYKPNGAHEWAPLIWEELELSSTCGGSSYEG